MKTLSLLGIQWLNVDSSLFRPTGKLTYFSELQTGIIKIDVLFFLLGDGREQKEAASRMNHVGV